MLRIQLGYDWLGISGDVNVNTLAMNNEYHDLAICNIDYRRLPTIVPSENVVVRARCPRYVTRSLCEVGDLLVSGMGLSVKCSYF